VGMRLCVHACVGGDGSVCACMTIGLQKSCFGELDNQSNRLVKGD